MVTSDLLEPAEVTFGLWIATDIGVGYQHTCALLESVMESDNALHIRCWGSGGDAALGLENTDNIGEDEGVDSATYDADVMDLAKSAHLPG